MSLEANIWLGCHASYNDGYLFDKQYTVTDSSDIQDARKDFEAHVVKSVSKLRPEWVKDGYISETYAEELYLADYEITLDDEHVSADFGESIGCLETFLDNFTTESYSAPILLLIEVAKNRGADLDDLQDIDNDLFYFEVDSKSDSDLAYAYCEHTGFFDQYTHAPETLIQYFDYDSFGRDLGMEFTVYDIGNTYYAVSSN